MKRKNLKPMIISALLAVGFGATSVGTSFALFTDHADTTINVTAGKVKVSSEVTTFKAYSMDPEDNDDEVERTTAGSFYNGGTFALEGTTITLNKITPGDRVTFKLNTANESNVDIKARFGVTINGSAKLAQGLVIKSGNTVIAANSRTNWAVVEAGDPLAEAAQDIEISLPKERGNEYQNLTVSLTFGFEAVQANALVKNDVEVDATNKIATIENEIGWNMLAAQVNSGANDYSGYVVKLDADLDFNGSIFNEIGTKTHPFKGSFDGNGKTVKNASKDYAAYEEDESYAGIIGYFSHTDANSTGEIKNLKVDNVNFTNAFYAGGVVGYYWSNNGNLHDCEAKNVTITTARNGGGVMGGGWSLQVYNCKAENIDITLEPIWIGTEYDEGNDAGGLIGGIPDDGDTKIIKDNTVKNVRIKAYRNIGAIIGKTYADHLTFTGNVIEGTMNFIIDQQTGWYGNKAIQLDFPERTDGNPYLGIGIIYNSPTSDANIQSATNSSTSWTTSVTLHS